MQQMKYLKRQERGLPPKLKVDDLKTAKTPLANRIPRDRCGEPDRGVGRHALPKFSGGARHKGRGRDVARYVPGGAAPTLHNSSKKRWLYAISIEPTLFGDGACPRAFDALAALQNRKRGTGERSSSAFLFRHRPFYVWLDSASGLWMRRWRLARQLYTRNSHNLDYGTKTMSYEDFTRANYPALRHPLRGCGLGPRDNVLGIRAAQPVRSGAHFPCNRKTTSASVRVARLDAPWTAPAGHGVIQPQPALGLPTMRGVNG